MKSNITSYSEYYNHIKKYVEDCDLVIWDDIAHKVGTDYEISNLFSIIDRRLGRGKANIYTSNINPSDLGKLIDTRLASRVSNASINIELHGGDKRGLNYAIN
jgi:DNA replication protein DnaC